MWSNGEPDIRVVYKTVEHYDLQKDRYHCTTEISVERKKAKSE